MLTVSKKNLVLGLIFAFLLGASAALFPASLLLRRMADDWRVVGSETLLLAAQGFRATRACHRAAGEHLKLYDALTDVTAVPYANPGANCYDHTKLLQERLREEGIESSIFVNHDRSHAWVAVWVDPTLGGFISPTASATAPYGPVLEVRGYADNHEVIWHR